MSESGGSSERPSVRDRLRGEFAREFLKAVRYDEDEIALLGDLSRVSATQVKELLVAKREEIKKIEDFARTPRPFKPLSDDDDEKPT